MNATSLIAGSESEGICIIDGLAHELYHGDTIAKNVGDTWEDGSGGVYEVVQNGDETTWREVAECAYCGSIVPASDDVPEASDSEAWTRLAGEHADDCEWIATRAHRVTE